jgi:hypothetical protein
MCCWEKRELYFIQINEKTVVKNTLRSRIKIHCGFVHISKCGGRVLELEI